MSTERIIGIDFGTSTSVIRVKRYQDGQPVDTDRLEIKPVKFNVSEDVAPTVIQRTPGGSYYGSNALVRKRGEKVFSNFKVDLESDDSAVRQQARELTEEFFGYMYQAYSNDSAGGNLGDSGDTEKTIVSYPVKWSDETKAFMLECAKKAGFKNVTGMDEASAAIHAALVRSEETMRSNGYLRDGEPCNIMLVDMGAGTTDIVICRYTPGKDPDFKVLATWPQTGEALFGGHETDDILRDYVTRAVSKEIREKVEKRFNAMKFKAWKEATVSEQLQNKETVTSFVALEEYVWDLEGDMDELALDRAEFERIAADYLAEYTKMINDSIAAAHLDPSKIDLVVLTGGHSQWYFADELLTDLRYLNLPKIRRDKGRILRLVRPQETVAMGMVYTPIHVEPVSAPEPEPKPKPDPIPDPKPKPNPKPISQTALINGFFDDTGKTVREIHTMPKSREDIIRYYQRFMHSLVTVAGDGSIYVIHPDGRILTTGNLGGSSGIATSVARVFSNLDGIVYTDTNGSVRTNVINYRGMDISLSRVQTWNNIALITDTTGGGFRGLRFDGKVEGLLSASAENSGRVIDIYHAFNLYNDHSNFNVSAFDEQLIAAFRPPDRVKDGYALAEGGKVLTYRGEIWPANAAATTGERIVSLTVAKNKPVFVTESKRVISGAPDFSFQNWNDVVAICAYPYASDKNLCFVGITESGSLRIKKYAIQSSFFRGTQISLLEEKELDAKLF